MSAGQTLPQDRLAQEVRELEKLGHEYQVRASVLLRSGRPGWEAWFEAGLELKRVAQRLGLITPASRFRPPVLGLDGRSGERTTAQRVIRPVSPPTGPRRSE